jgi:glyoxylase-like metal-dependent hydrolase (beta-lactamase superfamily II)
MPINIQSFFDADTATFTHVVNDVHTKQTAIIDAVLNYNLFSAHTHTTSADTVIAYIQENQLKLEWILETHIHADHLTAAKYIKSKLGGSIGIGSGIKQVLQHWVPLLNTASDTAMDASQFDCLFADNEIFTLGDSNITVMHTPGHTPACVCYLIENTVFTGDTLFQPDLGTARADFPGGSASMLFDSIQRILHLPEETIIYLCHDYPPEGRTTCATTTVREEKLKNIFINANVTKDEYITLRNKRDAGLTIPKLLLPAIQVNLRAGSFGEAEQNGKCYLKIPVDTV